MRVGYVVKRYPRFSETFIVNEILGHEAAGAELEIFSLRPPNDSRFQDLLGCVHAPVTYLPETARAEEFWRAFSSVRPILPAGWHALVPDNRAVTDEVYQDAYQAMLLAREVLARRIDHLHAHFASVATSVTRLAAGWTGRSYTFTAHAKDIYHRDVNPEVLRRNLADASATVTVSNYNRAYLRRIFGEAAARVERIYNGLDLDRFPYAPPVARPGHILAVGRLVEKKGFADLVEACALLDRRGRRFECIIVGSGQEEASLREQVERLGLEASVILAGARTQREVIDYYRQAAVFAAPCVVGSDGNQDGLPTVLTEAMALGTPCISTAVAGIPELVRDGETGLLVPQHDPPALASALDRLLAEDALRLRLSRAARALIEGDFDVYRNAAQLRAIFCAAQAEVAGARESAAGVPAMAGPS